MHDYLEVLLANLKKSFGVGNGTLRVSLESDDVTLDMERSVLCGLLVNELDTNSITHAFPAGRHGVIRVSLRAFEEHVELLVSDDGIGASEDFSSDRSATLGYTLIHTGIRQLKAKMLIDTESGTRVRVTFDATKPSTG